MTLRPDRAPAGVAVLLSQQPYQAFARVAQAFYPQLGRVRTGDDCHIGANATFARGSGDAKFANSGVRSPPSSD